VDLPGLARAYVRGDDRRPGVSVPRFPFRFDPVFRGPLLALGVTPASAHVDVDDEELRVRFGPWSLVTPRSNIVTASAQGPHRWWRAVGPRLSLSDGGVTFGTNADATTCVELREPVHGLEPLGVLRHPNISLSVEDVDRLAALLRR